MSLLNELIQRSGKPKKKLIVSLKLRADNVTKTVRFICERECS